MTKLNIDQKNIILMLLSLITAFVFPFELVLISYAFLGPAHYLTQISWMHDRDYFINWKLFWMPCVIIVLLLTNAEYILERGSDKLGYFLITLALSLSLSVVMFKDIWKRIAMTLVVVTAFWLAQTTYLMFAAAIIILLPSVIHIYVFTGGFILRGAIKDKNLWGITSFVTFVLCGLAFLFVTPMDIKISESFVSSNIGIFNYVSKFLSQVLSIEDTVNIRSVLGFLSFAYTYHYLNWFSKVNIIKWNQISSKRLGVIIFLYLSSISLYIIDYSLGLLALFFLSFLHVVLEFPLNIMTFRDIGSSIKLSIFKR